MSTVLYPLLFIAGLAAADLARAIRAAHARARIRASIDLACQVWTADPANWCARPGCTRCWGGPW
ncbi:hypothetical protein [Nonomuraea longicatena]|uniref:Uncharacterized protein n=1 Tax=Nonomuraea longicatena TaxID=83682 RepID=A0ABN1R2J5_9ACTN